MKNFCTKIGIPLLILSAVFLCGSITNLSKVQPVSAYEDQGIHTFSPYRIYPTQVENTGTGRQKRLHPTKTVYVIQYRATDGTGYQWQEEASYRSIAEDIVSNGQPVERRVLSIKENGRYITINKDLTAKSYVTSQRQRYIVMAVASTAYLVIYIVSCIVIWRKQHRRTS